MIRTLALGRDAVLGEGSQLAVIGWHPAVEQVAGPVVAQVGESEKECGWIRQNAAYEACGPGEQIGEGTEKFRRIAETFPVAFPA